MSDKVIEDMSEYKVTPDGKVKISINVPLNTLVRLDDVRKKENKTRSHWITQVILEKFSK
jgi:hypothetical protein